MSEIEQQFFETFGIDPKYKYKIEILGFENSTCIAIVDFPNMKELQKCYGERLKIIEKFDETITDRVLLELICLITQIELYDYSEKDYYTSFNYKDLKQEIISKANRLGSNNAILETTGESFKSKIQELFKENNEWKYRSLLQ